MWVLAHVAPWNWGAAVAVILVGLLDGLGPRLAIAGRAVRARGLALVPFAIFCFTPLTLPATTWLSAAIIWLPSHGLGRRCHPPCPVPQNQGPRQLIGAVLWLVVGLLSFEKTLVVCLTSSC